MKKQLLSMLAVLLAGLAGAQNNNVGIGTTTPDSSAKLDISSATQGILLPRMTAAERTAIKNPATSLLVFQTDAVPGFYWYNGSGWFSIGTNQQVASSGYMIGVPYLLAGNNTYGDVDGIGAGASLTNTSFFLIDSVNNLYFASNSGRIRKVTPSGVVTTIAGDGTYGYRDTTVALAARFSSPVAIAMDKAGNIYVTDVGNHRVRKISTTGAVTTLAGTGARGYVNGRADSAVFNFPQGIVTDASDNVYVIDNGSSRIRKITQAGVVSTFAGSGANAVVDGNDTSASFGFLGIAMTIDRTSGNIYVPDNYRIRKITPAGVVSTIAGSGYPGSADGTGSSASFGNINAITIDVSGNLYVVDNMNIRKITPAGVVTTLLTNIGISPTALAIDRDNQVLYAFSGTRIFRIAIY